METPLKVAYFSKIAEILSTGLAAQNVEFCSTKILLMHDWVFLLGTTQNDITENIDLHQFPRN
jgi:hypothetical protein